MDTASLESAYQSLLDVAEHGEFGAGPDDGWDAEMVLAHVTVNDDLLLAAGRAVLAHAPDVSYDNAAAVDEANLRGQGPLSALIDRLQTSGQQLCDVAAQLTGGLDEVLVPVHIVDGGQVVVDQPMPIGRLLQIHATVHLPSHLSQLEQLRA
jgi:hypothetical protein